MKFWLPALVLAFAGLSDAQNVSLAVNSTGLSALTWNGTSFLGDGRFKLNGVLLQSGTNPAVAGDLTATTQMNSWIKLSTSTYKLGNGLGCLYDQRQQADSHDHHNQHFSFHHHGSVFEPLDLQFPAAVAEFDGVDPMLQSRHYRAKSAQHELRIRRHGAGQ